jgi:hypothetical protein
MKNIAFFWAAAMLFGCASVNRIEENTMYITREYCGTFVKQDPEKKRYQIYTSDAVFHIIDGPVDVPQGARCYFQSKEELLPTGTKVWILYFTWDGTDKLYQLSQNFITGELL